MGAAHEVLGRETEAFEQRRHDAHVFLFACVRRTDDRQFGVGEAERVGRPRGDDGQRLKGFGGRPQENGDTRVTHPAEQTPTGVGHGDHSPVDLLDRVATH